MKKKFALLLLLACSFTVTSGCYQYFDWDHLKKIGASIKRDLDRFNEATDRYFLGYDPHDPYQQLGLDE
ncbi:MAG: hypothetical protein NUW37_10725 [Planctomycetes bacterium]|nr:hypothetical protein [Planctomycetota bacterium]